MSLCQQVYRDLEDRIKKKTSSGYVVVKDEVAQEYVTKLRQYQKLHVDCAVAQQHLEVATTSQALTPIDTNQQRLIAENAQLKARVAALEFENNEFKTGSAPRTLGTPISESSPPTSAKEVWHAVRYLIDNPQYLRIATTNSLVTLLRTAEEHCKDDGEDEGLRFGVKTHPHTVIERLDDIQPGPKAGRIWDETYRHSLREWIEDTYEPSSESSGSEKSGPTAPPPPESTDIVRREPPVASPEAPKDEPPSPVDTELVLEQEPLGPTGKRKEADYDLHPDDDRPVVKQVYEQALPGEVSSRPTGTPGQQLLTVSFPGAAAVTHADFDNLAAQLRGERAPLTAEDLAAIAGSDSDVQVGSDGVLYIGVSDDE